MRILATSYLSKNGIQLNNEPIESTDIKQENWLKSIYSSLEIDYPKFHKMDNISKMAFLGTSILHEELDAIEDTENNLELIFSNASSSQTTDIKFIDSYQNQGAPSPALFIYTLPNIVTGELAIRYKWYGENVFFISETFDAELFENQIKFTFCRGNSHCLCAWVESNSDGNEECFVFLVAKSEKENILNNLDFQTELKNRLNQYRNE